MDVPALRAAWSRASALVHERHPERLDGATVATEITLLEEDARKLKEWLWLHIIFLRGEGFLLQMGQFGTPSFFVSLTRAGDLPEGMYGASKRVADPPG